jgi:hypothetical protein
MNKPIPLLPAYLQDKLNQFPRDKKSRMFWSVLAQSRLSESKIKIARSNQTIPGWHWPEWCYVPNVLLESIAWKYGLYQQSPFAEWQQDFDDGLMPSEAESENLTYTAEVLAVLARWRLGKGFYSIHPKMLEYLREGVLPDTAPVGVLMHFPEYCLAVETPGFWFHGKRINAMIAYLNSSFPDNQTPYLVIHLFDDFSREWAVYTRSIRLNGDTLEDCWKNSSSDYKKSGLSWESECSELKPFIAVLLYLCSKNREINSPEGREFDPPKPIVRKNKQPAAGKIQQWHVAWRIGSALEAAEKRTHGGIELDGQKEPLKPHVRRAHWHLYWKKDKDTDEKIPVIHWLLPIPVNITSITDAVATGHSA